MFHLLLWLLFICEVESINIQQITDDVQRIDHGWYIRRTGEVPEREAKFDCNKFGILCSEMNCLPFAHKMGDLPTEDALTSSPPLINAGSKGRDFRLICLSNNYLRVTKTSISGIVQNNGTLDWAAITAQHDGEWKVELLKSKISDGTKDIKSEKEQEGMQVSHQLPCKAAQIICDKNLKSCIQEKGISYPYLTVDVYMDKFNKIASCDDKGQIEGEQCTEILCTEKAGYDDDSQQKDRNMGIPAIVKCERKNKAHLIYYHKSRDIWCLSKYEISEGDVDQTSTTLNQKSTTLQQMLEKQVVDKREIDYLLTKIYDPRVKSYWFFGDAEDAIVNKNFIPSDAYDKIKIAGLINYKLGFKDLGTENYKDIFKEFRRCSFVIDEKTDKNKNCNDKTVTPWDILQLAIIQGVVPSATKRRSDIKNSEKKPADVVNDELNKANKENAKKDAARGKTSKLKPDDPLEEAQASKGNNDLPIRVLCVLIPMLLIIIPSVYFLHI